MKIKLAIACMALMVMNQVNAQQIRGGINFANVSVDENGRVDEANMNTSFHVGLVGNMKIGTSLLAIQPGLYFTGKGSKIQRDEPGQITYYKQTVTPYYFELPVNLVARAPLGASNKLFVGAGPYIGVGIAGKSKTETALSTSERDIRYSDDDPTTLNQEEGTGYGVLKRFDYGLNGTAGFEGKFVVLYVNYGLGLAKLQSGSNNGADNNDKHRVLGVGLGFKF